jgi:hypothetical protein
LLHPLALRRLRQCKLRMLQGLIRHCSILQLLRGVVLQVNDLLHMQVDLPFCVVEFELVHRRGLLLARGQDRRIDCCHGDLGARLFARLGACLGTSLGTPLNARLLAHAVSTSRQLTLQAEANIRLRGSCR